MLAKRFQTPYDARVSQRPTFEAVMPVRPIDPFPDDDGDGFEFGEFWGDPVLVGATLTRLSLYLQPSICYCLKFQPVHGGNSWFEPYGANGLCTDPLVTFQLNTRIPHRRLFCENNNTWTWPKIGQWLPGADDSFHPRQLADAAWHGLFRAKENGQYVGVLKSAIVNGKPPDDDLPVRLAYRQVKAWLDAEVFARRHNGHWSTSTARESLTSTSELIAGDLRNGFTERAIQRVATLLTSHLGADFNRAVCLAYDSSKAALCCVYSHGGNCSTDWSENVQLPLSQSFGTIHELQTNLKLPPVDDPLYQDLVGEHSLRLNDERTRQSIIARIWVGGGGDLEQLPKENAVEDGPPMPDFAADGNVSPTYNVAAQIRLESDPWLVDLRQKRPNSPLLSSRNGSIFALPWTLDGELIAIWLLDLGYWPEFSLVRDIVPRLRSAKALLSHFAPRFRGVNPLGRR
jgi:hypothetical protein